MSEESSEDTDETPKFRGCVFCYAAEWTAYGARKLKSR